MMNVPVICSQNIVRKKELSSPLATITHIEQDVNIAKTMPTFKSKCQYITHSKVYFKLEIINIEK